MTQERITAAAVAVGVALLIWLIGKIIKGGWVTSGRSWSANSCQFSSSLSWYSGH